MGPAAVTLKAGAARIDRTLANLLHHCCSAAGLQKALAAYQAETVCATIGRKMAESPPGERNVREIVDLAFDAFNEGGAGALATRSEEHTSELQSLMRISYAVFCLKKKKKQKTTQKNIMASS